VCAHVRPHTHARARAGELALSRGQLELATSCLTKAQDLSGLLLLAAAKGDREGLAKLTDAALEAGKHNVAFVCLFLLGKVGAARLRRRRGAVTGAAARSTRTAVLRALRTADGSARHPAHPHAPHPHAAASTTG
jgi:hypothetical protein